MDRLHLALGMTTALVLGIGIGHARTSMYSFFSIQSNVKLPKRAVMEHSYMKRQIKRGKGHYSKAVVANGMVFVSGILPIKHSSDGKSEKMTDSSFAEQTSYVLNRLKATLEDSGSALRKLVSVRVYVDDIAN